MYLLILIVALLCPAAYAQVPSPSPAVSPTPPPESMPVAAAPKQPVEPKAETPPARRVNFSVSGFYALGSYIGLSNVVVTQGSNSGTGSGNYSTSTAFGLGAEISSLPERNLSWMAGIDYEFPRTLNSATFSGVNGTATSAYTGTAPTLAFLLFKAGAIYRVGYLYIPFGLNFNIPSYQSGSSTTTTVVVGGLGGQVGLGYYVSENLALEIQLRYLTASATATAGTTIANYNTMTFVDPSFGLKYTF